MSMNEVANPNPWMSIRLQNNKSKHDEEPTASMDLSFADLVRPATDVFDKPKHDVLGCPLQDAFGSSDTSIDLRDVFADEEPPCVDHSFQVSDWLNKENVTKIEKYPSPNVKRDWKQDSTHSLDGPKFMMVTRQKNGVLQVERIPISGADDTAKRGDWKQTITKNRHRLGLSLSQIKMPSVQVHHQDSHTKLDADDVQQSSNSGPQDLLREWNYCANTGSPHNIDRRTRTATRSRSSSARRSSSRSRSKGRRHRHTSRCGPSRCRSMIQTSTFSSKRTLSEPATSRRSASLKKLRQKSGSPEEQSVTSSRSGHSTRRSKRRKGTELRRTSTDSLRIDHIKRNNKSRSTGNSLHGLSRMHGPHKSHSLRQVVSDDLSKGSISVGRMNTRWKSMRHLSTRSLSGNRSLSTIASRHSSSDSRSVSSKSVSSGLSLPTSLAKKKQRSIESSGNHSSSKRKSRRADGHKSLHAPDLQMDRKLDSKAGDSHGRRSHRRSSSRRQLSKSVSSSRIHHHSTSKLLRGLSSKDLNSSAKLPRQSSLKLPKSLDGNESKSIGKVGTEEATPRPNGVNKKLAHSDHILHIQKSQKKKLDLKEVHSTATSGVAQRLSHSKWIDGTDGSTLALPQSLPLQDNETATRRTSAFAA